MYHRGIKLSDALIERAAHIYTSAVTVKGTRYIYKRLTLLSDGSVLIGIYEPLSWTGYTPKVAEVVYTPPKK